MNFIPTALKVVLNIIFYCIYVVLFSLGVGIALNRFMWFSFHNGDPLAIKIGWFLIVLIFIVTFIFRTFFYISLKK